MRPIRPWTGRFGVTFMTDPWVRVNVHGSIAPDRAAHGVIPLAERPCDSGINRADPESLRVRHPS